MVKPNDNQAEEGDEERWLREEMEILEILELESGSQDD